MQNIYFKPVTLYHDRTTFNLKLDKSSFLGDANCKNYKIMNQLIRLSHIYLPYFDRKDRSKFNTWSLFNIVENSKTLTHYDFTNFFSLFENLLNHKPVILYNTNTFRDPANYTCEKIIEDNEYLTIVLDNKFEKKLDEYTMTFANFKKILDLSIYDFYKQNSHLFQAIKDVLTENELTDIEGTGNDREEFGPAMFEDTKFIHMFDPERFNLDLEFIILDIIYLNAKDGTKTQEQRLNREAKLAEVLKQIATAKYDYWTILEMTEFEKYSIRLDESKLEGAYFNVNNIWNNKGNKTETSKTWDIIDSIGIVMMRLLPLLFIILLIVIIIMIVKINKNKCGCNK